MAWLWINTIKLKRGFYLQPTLTVAQQMLGKFLIRKIKGKKVGGMITETEAYIGPLDKASHAYGGRRTKRNEAEFMTGGYVYIYLVYGMYWQLNISTYKEGEPECVLIRALEPMDGIETMIEYRKRNAIHRLNVIPASSSLTNGPGKLCQALKLDKSFYGVDVCARTSTLYLEDRGVTIKKSDIIKTPRIGIDYAGPYWAKMPWRFVINPDLLKSDYNSFQY